MLSTVSMTRSGVGVERDLEKWEDAPSLAKLTLQQESGRVGEHQVVGGAFCPVGSRNLENIFLRREASGAICILAGAF